MIDICVLLFEVTNEIYISAKAENCIEKLDNRYIIQFFFKNSIIINHAYI